MKKISLLAAVGASMLGLSACSSPSPDPVEQIIVREPGRAEATAVAPAMADPVAAGRAAFAACVACHSVEAGGESGVGPNLHGVVGRAAGSVDGFDYSDAMKGAGLTWDADALDAFLADPETKVSGTTMTSGVVEEDEKRSAIIAYLSSLSE